MVRRNRKLCIAVARDTIVQLRLKRFNAIPGVYINIDFDENEYIEYDEKFFKQSFSDYFKKAKKTTCNVCALGAAFVSLVNVENKCSVGGVINENGMWTRLQKAFGTDNMSLMESAFECTPMDSSNSKLSEEMLDQAADWGSKYKDDNDRLRAIMMNVIRNGGDFKLPKKLIAKAKANAIAEAEYRTNW